MGLEVEGDASSSTTVKIWGHVQAQPISNIRVLLEFLRSRLARVRRFSFVLVRRFGIQTERPGEGAEEMLTPGTLKLFDILLHVGTAVRSLPFVWDASAPVLKLQAVQREDDYNDEHETSTWKLPGLRQALVRAVTVLEFAFFACLIVGYTYFAREEHGGSYMDAIFISFGGVMCLVLGSLEGLVLQMYGENVCVLINKLILCNTDVQALVVTRTEAKCRRRLPSGAAAGGEIGRASCRERV